MSRSICKAMRRVAVVVSFFLWAPGAAIWGQDLSSGFPTSGQGRGEIKVTSGYESIELVLGSSRLISTPFNIPRVVVEDPSILSATPLAKDQILIRALQSGVTGIGILDENDRSYTVEVNVVNDVRQLQAVINHTFPTANITVRPLKDAVVLIGTVPNPEMTAQVVDVASKFSDQVFQNLQVSGAQNIALRMKIYEVSRTKLRRIGADWQISSGRFNFLQSVGDLVGLDGNGNAVANGATVRASITGSDSNFFYAMELLEQHDAARLLDEPTLVTLNGRPAEFLSGGEVPILVNAGLGVASIEFRPFGTKVDFLPIVLGDGRSADRPAIRSLPAGPGLGRVTRGHPASRSAAPTWGPRSRPGTR
jgi:pilus assembly protein CpaC